MLRKLLHSTVALKNVGTTVKNVNFVRLSTTTSSASSSSPLHHHHQQQQVEQARPHKVIHRSACPTCLSLLQKRFIHNPETFKHVIKKPFEWGYGSENGPYSWFQDHPVAIRGRRQSPIHIFTKDVVKDEILKGIPLRWQYHPDKCIDIQNTGRSWTVHVNGDKTGLIGGPLTNEFELWQFHAHWGNTDDHGSEHTVDGVPYPAELHLVHWNSSKYRTPTEAVHRADGLAVLGVFMELSEKPHEEFSKVTDLLTKIRFRDQRAPCDKPIDVSKFLPTNETEKRYWTYDGSLTTPPLLESVTWIVFQKTMKISSDQLDTMRSLLFTSLEEWEKGKAEYMVNNFRPPVPTGDRIIRAG